GLERNEAGIETVSARLFTNATFPEGRTVSSRNTCVEEVKPAPKICTPASAFVEVSVPCGISAPGIPPMVAPATGGTCNSVISTLYKRVEGVGPRFTTRICWLPDCATTAWLVAGSTATAQNNVRFGEAPPAMTVICDVPVPGSLICC